MMPTICQGSIPVVDGVVKQHQLGCLFLQGGDGVKVDTTEAVRWFTLAASQGYPPSQYALGQCYSKGLGVWIDCKMAALWYHAAAEQNHPKAAFKLAQCCETGKGVGKDLQQSIKWYAVAARNGHADAIQKLLLLKTAT